MAASPIDRSQALRVTAAYYLAYVSLGLTLAAVGPVLPTLGGHTGTDLDEISLIFITNSLGYMAGTGIVGRLYDRMRGHWIMAGALLLASLMLAILPTLSALWLLAILMAVLGFFQGSVDVGGNTLLIWLHGAKVGPFMNGMHFCFGAGALLAPIVVAQVTGLTGDIHWVYWAFALLNIPIALWILTLPSPKLREKAGTMDHPRVHASPVILALLVAFFLLYVGMESGFGNWIYTYALTTGMADAARAAYLTSAFWGAFTLFRLVGVWISTRTSPQNILTGNFAGAAIGLGLILVWLPSQAALWIGTIILGASLATIFPTMMTLAEQRLHLTGSVTSWFFIGSGVGHMFLPWLIGQVFEPIGPASMMVLITVDLALNALAFALVLVKSKHTI